MLMTLCDLNCGGSSMRYALGLMIASTLNGPYHRSSKTVGGAMEKVRKAVLCTSTRSPMLRLAGLRCGDDFCILSRARSRF